MLVSSHRDFLLIGASSACRLLSGSDTDVFLCHSSLLPKRVDGTDRATAATTITITSLLSLYLSLSFPSLRFSFPSCTARFRLIPLALLANQATPATCRANGMNASATSCIQTAPFQSNRVAPWPPKHVGSFHIPCNS